MDEQPAGLEMALKVASWGWRVAPGFCSRQGEKVPLCGNWVENASTDSQVLEKWWDERNWLWPGVVSGVGSCIVLDCDKPEAVDWFRSLVAREGWHRGGLIYRTPGKGGGLHCVWNWPEFLGADFRQAKVTLPSGGEVQIRGNGHWTLLCGAKRPDGVYEVLEVPDDVYGPLAAPQTLLQAILRESVVHVGKVVSGDLVELSPEDAWAGAPYTDGRKNAVAGLAWYMAIRGVDRTEVISTCVRFGADCCLPQLSEETCMKKAEYAIQRANRFRQAQNEKTNELLSMWSKWQ